MRIQPTGYNNYNQNFGAKLSMATLQEVSKEFKNTPEGNQALENLLKKVRDIGLKDTTLSVGAIETGGRYVYVGYEYPDEYTSYDYRSIIIDNPLFAGIKKCFTQDFSVSTLASTLEAISRHTDAFKKAEKELFQDYLSQNYETQPMKIFSNLLPALSTNKESLKAMFETAKLADEKYLENQRRTISTKQKELATLKKELNDSKNLTENCIAETEKIIEIDTKTERDAILNEYA